MTKPQLIALKTLVGAISAGLVLTAQAAYLEQDYEKQSRPRPERIIPPPRPRNEICDLVSRIRVGGPVSVKNLTIFPLRLSPPWGHFDCKTLDESLSRGYIEILEQERPNVREVMVRNNSRHYVFLMAGEALGGGKQNRLVSEDVLLRPHGRVIRVPVYCIEKGRWSSGKPRLGSGGFLAPARVRKLAREKASQRAVWDSVSGLLRETGSRSENEDLAAAYENREVAEKMAGYRREIHITLRDTVGCVAVLNGRIVASDIFTSAELFGKLRRKLLDSYALDAIAKEHRPGRWPSPPSEGEIRRFLERVFRASFRERDARDAGRIVEIAGGGIDGQALIFGTIRPLRERGRDVVHVHLTPRPEVRF